MAYKRLTCVAERAAIGNGNRAGTSVDSRYVRIRSHTMPSNGNNQHYSRISCPRRED